MSRGVPKEANKLYNQILARFDLEEFRTLCFELGVEYDDLRGEGRAARARELVRLLNRQGRLAQLAQHLRLTTPPLASSEADYMDYMRQQYGYIPLGGIAPRIQDRVLQIPLGDLFVAPQAEANAPLQTQFVVIDRQGYQAVRAGNLALVGIDELKAAPRSVILGAPGAGKTTLLRWLVAEALQSLDISGGSASDQHPLPLFVRLAHMADVLEQHPSLTFDQYLREWYLPNYRMVVEQALAHGRIWLLLDGLDEIASPRVRQLVRDAIEAFQIQFPHIEHIVVTSRTVGYRRAQMSNAFRHFTLQPFGASEIAQFIRNWYRSLARLTQAQPDERTADTRADRLIEGLKDKPRVMQLAGTPLFLAMIALMDWKGKAIPKRRVELYEAAITTLIEDWPSEHGRPTQDELTMDEMLRILGQLSLAMFTTSADAAIRQDALEQQVAKLIRAVRDCNQADAMQVTRRWLPLLSEHAGLLLNSGVDSYSRPIYTFLHLSFVEYLCGRALAEQWRAGIIQLADYANDARWHEVLRLMAGHIGMDDSVDAATNLVHALRSLEFPQDDVLHQSLLLVAACLADDVPMAVRPRQQVLDDIVALWHASPPSRLKSRLFRLLAAMRGTESAVDVIARIMPMLEQAHDQTRSSIIELLGYLGDAGDQALELRLLTALRDPAMDVQRAAVRAFGMLDLAVHAQVRAALLAALQHPNTGVRTRAVLAVGPYATIDRAVADALMRVLEQDGHDEPRRMAARVFGGGQHPGNDVLESLYTTMLNGSSTIRKEAVAGFAHWDVASQAWLIATLRQALRDPVLAQRRKVVEAIADMSLVIRHTARDLLIDAANDDTNHDLLVRVPILRALGSLPEPNEQVQNLLLAALSDTHPKIRIAAAAALHRLAIRKQPVCVGLIQALRDGNSTLQRQAAEALITCGMPDHATIGALDHALSDGDETIRLHAARALINLKKQDPKAEQIVIALLQSANAEIRRLATEAIRDLAPALPTSVISTLISLVRDDNRNVREQALRGLAELGSRATGDIATACRAALDDSYHGVRVCAAEALGRIGQADQLTINALLAALSDPNDHVRLAASSALVALGERTEREIIIQHVRALLDQSPHVEDALNTLWELVVGE